MSNESFFMFDEDLDEDMNAPGDAFVEDMDFPLEKRTRPVLNRSPSPTDGFSGRPAAQTTFIKQPVVRSSATPAFFTPPDASRSQSPSKGWPTAPLPRRAAVALPIEEKNEGAEFSFDAVFCASYRQNTAPRKPRSS